MNILFVVVMYYNTIFGFHVTVKWTQSSLFSRFSTVPLRAADGVHCIRMLSSVSLFFFSTVKVTRAVNIIYNSFAIRLFFLFIACFSSSQRKQRWGFL